MTNPDKTTPPQTAISDACSLPMTPIVLDMLKVASRIAEARGDKYTRLEHVEAALSKRFGWRKKLAEHKLECKSVLASSGVTGAVPEHPHS